MTTAEAVLPQIVQSVLQRHGLVAIPAEELEALRARPEHSCPYPLFPWKYGVTHDEYLGTILEREDEPLSGVHVVRCSACHQIRLETPVALA